MGWWAGAAAAGLAATAPAPADRALIAGSAHELAWQAAAVVVARPRPGGFLVEAYLKGEGPRSLALDPLPKPPAGRVLAFLAQTPGVPGRFAPLPFGTDGAVAVFALDGDRAPALGASLAEVRSMLTPRPRQLRLKPTGPEIE